MSLLTLISILAGVCGAGKDIADIITDLHTQGFKPGDMIPEVHMRKINDILGALPNADDEQWQVNHVSEGG